MKSQRLLLTSTTVVLGAIAITNRAIASEATFHCQSNGEIPATVIKSNNGAEQSIFN